MKQLKQLKLLQQGSWRKPETYTPSSSLFHLKRARNFVLLVYLSKGKVDPFPEFSTNFTYINVLSEVIAELQLLFSLLIWRPEL